MLKSLHGQGNFKDYRAYILMRTVHGERRPKCVDFSYACLLPAKLERHLQSILPSPKWQAS